MHSKTFPIAAAARPMAGRRMARGEARPGSCGAWPGGGGAGRLACAVLALAFWSMIAGLFLFV